MAVLLVLLLQIFDPVLMLAYKIEQVSLQIQLFKRILSTVGVIISNGETRLKGSLSVLSLSLLTLVSTQVLSLLIVPQLCLHELSLTLILPPKLF